MGDQGPYACATAVARATPVDIKNLMTGFNRNSKFCFTEILKVPRSEAEGTLRSRGNKTHYTSQLNTKKKRGENVCRLAHNFAAVSGSYCDNREIKFDVKWFYGKRQR